MISFDMDGVLVKYDWDGYKTEVNGVPKYLTPSYYLQREPDDRALNLFRKCIKLFPNETCVITSVPKGEHRNRIVIDKLMWLNTHVPEFDIGTHVICCTSDKMSFIEWMRGSTITKNDILIDDYNPNLYSWFTRGGLAVKWLNGLNSPESWYGPILDGQNPYSHDLFSELMGILNRSEKLC